MPMFQKFDAMATLEDQLQQDEGPAVPINHFTVAPGDAAALIGRWSEDAEFMKAQPG